MPGWRRFLTPSLSDLVFISVIVWLFIAVSPGWDRLLGDGDTGWHIRVGESILQTGSVPQTDPFSFSKAGAPWYAWEWLSEVVLAATHQHLGLKGVTLGAGVMVALFAVLLLRYMLWLGATTLVAFLVTLLSVGAASIHYLARPHLVTFVFLIGAIWALERDRRRPDKWIWALVPLTIVWTNLHGGFLALFVCLGGLAAGSAIEGLIDPGIRQRRWRQVLRYSLLGTACAAASVVNPYGIELHRHIAAYVRSDWIKDVVAEFQSPSFRAENVLQYEVLLLLGVMVAAWLLMRRRVVEAIWILSWAHFSLTSARHIPIFVIFAAPLAASELSRLWLKWPSVRNPRSAPGILQQLSEDLSRGFARTSAWPYLFVLLLLFGGAWLRFPADFPDNGFPVALISRNADLIKSGRILADDDWADYLIYRFYPDQRVFMDGRTDFYGPEIGDKYMAAVYGKPGWSSVMEEYRFDLVLVPHRRALAALLKQDESWTIIDSDKLGIVFVRRPEDTVARIGAQREDS